MSYKKIFNVCAISSYSVSIGAMAFSNAYFGVGTGTILLDDVGCTGSETNLTDCTRSSTVSCIRGHTEDAGVRCQGKWFDALYPVYCRPVAKNFRRGVTWMSNLHKHTRLPQEIFRN